MDVSTVNAKELNFRLPSEQHFSVSFLAGTSKWNSV